MITKETRRESNKEVDKLLRYQQIKEILNDLGQATAKEIAVEMCKRKYTPTDERNFSAPRLTEMMDRGLVEVIEKTICKYTGKKVAVYTIK